MCKAATAQQPPQNGKLHAMTTTIRPARPDDYQAICDLIPNEEELFLVYPKGRHPLTVAQLERLLQKRLEPTVLLRDDRVVGFADFYRYKPGKSAYIGNVVVDPAQRGRAFGSEIIVHLIELAFSKYDLPRVRISVYARNDPALLLYGRLGFKPNAVREATDFRGDRVALLHLRLNRSDYQV